MLVILKNGVLIKMNIFDGIDILDRAAYWLSLNMTNQEMKELIELLQSDKSAESRLTEALKIWVEE